MCVCVRDARGDGSKTFDQLCANGYAVPARTWSDRVVSFIVFLLSKTNVFVIDFF